MQPSASSQRDVVTAAMDPLPAHCLGVLLTANTRFPPKARASVAQRALKDVHGLEVTETDVAFVFDKLESHLPAILKGVPNTYQGPLRVCPAVSSCPTCKTVFGIHARKVPVDLYSSAHGRSEGIAEEHHCDSCGKFFLGHWSYTRKSTREGDSPIAEYRLAGPILEEEFFLLPNNSMHKAAACSQRDLKLLTGVLHHARGSFHAAGEIFADMAGGKGSSSFDNAHKVMAVLWFAWALVRFLPWHETQKLDWTKYWFGGQLVNDLWLLGLKPLVRKYFVLKWAIGHLADCKTCGKVFAIGLDGKRGAKRFLCACLEGPPRYVPEVDAWLQQGCPRAPAYGSLYCQEHDILMESEDTLEEAGKILKHRSTESGQLQFYIETMDPEGDETSCCWVDAAEVAPSARRLYELGRLPETGPSGKKRKQRARTGSQASAPAGEHLLAEDEKDVGPCAIDKAAQGKAQAKKWQRRRLGGIIAAVSGCRLFLDWEEHQFGEGTSQVYVVLAGLVAAIMSSLAQTGAGKQPDVVFMDNACALWKYATNPKRQNRTEVTKTLKTFKYMLDMWHAKNHTACLVDPDSARVLDPRHEANQATTASIDTEACEQCFSFLDRIAYVALNMGPGHHSIFLYLIFDLENEKVVRRRRH